MSSLILKLNLDHLHNSAQLDSTHAHAHAHTLLATPPNVNMNEDLQERFSRSRKAAKGQPATGQAVVLLIPQQLNPRVREYFEQPKTTTQGGAWLNRPEIPTSEEVLDTETRASRITGEVELGANKPKGKWASKDEYLGSVLWIQTICENLR